MDIIAFIIGVLGTVLNIWKVRICFVIWFVSSCIWVYVGIASELNGLTMRGCVYAILAVCGWFKWKGEE